MSDFAAKLEAARRRLPLKNLMEQHGRGPSNGKWKSFAKCPYCDGDSCCGVFAGTSGVDLFKCHRTSCASGTGGEGGAWDEIGFLAHELGVDRKAAAVAYLKEAGVWVDRERLAPSVMPGKAGRKLATVEVPPNAFGDEAMLQECVRLMHAERAASPTLFQDRLGIALHRACEIVDELIRRGVLAASADGGYEILNLPAAVSVPQSDSVEAEPFTGPSGDEPESELNPVAGAPATQGGPMESGAAPASTGNPSAAQVEAPLSQSGDEVTPGDVPEGVPGDEVPAPLLALRWFYERLALSEEDREGLWFDRGLTAETCEALGYRSNPQSNKELLAAMADEFPVAVLEESGLWKAGDGPSDPVKPNPQFYGMSLVPRRDEKGKKVRDEEDDVVVDCVWNNPILIPYFDEVGDLVHLRPHKGMMRDKAPRFYMARPCRGWLAKAKPVVESKRTPFGLVTEGEFKAAAVWQVCREVGVAAGALPGITMVKMLFSEVVDWLEEVEIRKVLVVYDNEEKGDEKLPGYVKDEWKRYDATVWGRYLARQLGKEGYESRVGMLPDAWRNAAGKADWDGRLRDLVNAEGARVAGRTPAQVWSAVMPRARREFLEVAKMARPVHELWQAGFFDSAAERHIKSQLERISYELELPIGGDAEVVVARRLHRLVAKLKSGDLKYERLPRKMRNFLSMQAKQYLTTRGGYYIFKPLKEETIEKWAQERDKAQERDDLDVVRICEVAMKGVPNRISDFHFKPHYVLCKANGTRSRLVTIHNVHGVNTKMLSMPSSAFAQPSKFREWLLDSCSGATWSAGERELNRLQNDFSREVSFKDVIEVPLRGYHEPSRLWFFEDVAYGPDGEQYLPNPKTGIFWVSPDKDSKGIVQGYTFPRDSQGRPRDREGEVFRQGVPRMRPEIEGRTDLAEWFTDVARKCYETVGDFGGFMGLGMMLAYAAGPEVFREWSCFPGLWLHGEQGQGKSSFARWLIRIWGFDRDKGLPLPADERTGTLTAPAVAGALGQYGNQPLWLDEYQTTTPGWVRAILKNIYDRAEGAKRDFGQNPREFLTGVIVSGVATSSESQTKSRYAHVQLSSKRRLRDHYQWFQAESRDFYQFGRHLMRHRKEYVELFLPQLKAWMNSPSLAGVDDRMRMVHAVAYAGMHAMVELLGCCDLVDECLKYSAWLKDHCMSGEAEVHDQIGVNQFWRLLINANESHAFGHTPSELRSLFKVMPDYGVSELTEQQLKWGEQTAQYQHESLLLYFRPGPVLDMLRRYYRTMGKEMPMDQADLRSQMKTRAYWVETDSVEGHRQRFGDGGRSTCVCWCIRLDKHELGLQKMTDEEFEASWHVECDLQRDFIASTDWVDPRRGDLFTLVEALKSGGNE